MSELESTIRPVIEEAWEQRDTLGPGRYEPGLRDAVDRALFGLERGDLRVATPGDDGWTVRTADGALSAQFEHTVLVTARGAEVLTRA